MDDSSHDCWEIYQETINTLSSYLGDNWNEEIEEGFKLQLLCILFTLSYEDFFISQEEVDFINYVFDEGYNADQIEEILNAEELKIHDLIFTTTVTDVIGEIDPNTALSIIDSIQTICLSFIAIDEDINIDEIHKVTEIINNLKKSLLNVKRGDSKNITITNYSHSSINNPSYQEPDNLDQLLNELYDLIGLDTVKSEVQNLCNLVRVRKLREKSGLPIPPMSLHLVFTGNPGTGKTTVARLLSKIFEKLELLSIGHLVEVDRSSLVGGYVGQTAIKTKELIQNAIGGILFIDEAYTLSKNNSESDYGREAIDTLLKEMEDKRDNFIVIVAGYTGEMESFIHSNPGLESRFNKFIHFRDYTPEEMLDIFHLMVNKAGYKLCENAKSSVLTNMIHLYDQKNGEYFGNGRDVRNYFERVIQKHSNRIVKLMSPSPVELQLIKIEDV